MLYVKYIYPTGQEHISGPYEMVTAEWVDADGKNVGEQCNTPDKPWAYQVVYAYTRIALGESDIQPGQTKGATMTYGPNIPPSRDREAPPTSGETLPDPNRRRGKVYVMTEAGGTVAKHEL